MMTELCQELHNWFDNYQPKYYGTFTINNGAITSEDAEVSLQNGQYFRVIGSVFNDGVHEYPDAEMTDETFTGTIWAMAVPPAVIALAEELKDWMQKYGNASLSPYQSESFGGYSYSKGTTNSGNTSANWQAVYRSRLNHWRKLP